MTDARKVVLLGSTGSMGRQTLEVVRAHRDRFSLVGLATGADEAELQSQAREFGVTRFGLGTEAAVELATLPEADVVVNAIVGAAGLAASVAALGAGKVLALANKESLVAGGEVCRSAMSKGGGRIEPVDSEHAAVAQCLRGMRRESVARLVLTASGGPFRTRRDLDGVTPEEALAHPTWSMGPKITIDSATLMNKGLEVIEAHWLFDMSYDQIGVVVHPQSVVHGIVELADGSSLLQAAPPDMRIPIAAALFSSAGGSDAPLGYAATGAAPASVDLESVRTLEFEPLDHHRFPAVGLAYEAGRRGRSFPAVLNAANEVAVSAFLSRAIPFLRISRVVEAVLEAHEGWEVGNLEGVLAVDQWARRKAEELISGQEYVDSPHEPSKS